MEHATPPRQQTATTTGKLDTGRLCIHMKTKGALGCVRRYIAEPCWAWENYGKFVGKHLELTFREFYRDSHYDIHFSRRSMFVFTVLNIKLAAVRHAKESSFVGN